MFITNATVKIGGASGKDYAGVINSVEITNTTSTVTHKGMKDGSQVSYTTSPVYSVAMSFRRDWNTTNSLSDYLWDNASATPTKMQFFPDGASTGTKGWEVDVNLVRSNIGGAVDTVAVSTVTFSVIGEPRRITAA